MDEDEIERRRETLGRQREDGFLTAREHRRELAALARARRIVVAAKRPELTP